MYFLATETIIHPITRHGIVCEGEIITISEFAGYCEKYGMDNIKGTLCYNLEVAENLQSQMN